ncbi:MAG TPA: DUF294 nucleotidyltransferase-like domain-containing protein [Calditrichia bacterium]|nr:CBS domain-containing protein [Calditrichota bacterium]HQV31015.1 DUF294 nucleotidyltransferase-like domain-containing protein [Calditrichia bacterium]
MNDKLTNWLSGLVPFSILPEGELSHIAEKLISRDFEVDTILFTQQESAVDYLYIIESGALELFYQEGEAKRLQGYLEEGDTFGGISMLMNDCLAVRTVRVQESCNCLLLPKDDFLNICANHPNFRDHFSSTFGKQMLDRSYQQIVISSVHRGDKSFAPIINQQVASLAIREFAECPREMTIREAARLLNDKHQSAILVKDQDGTHIGIVTDKDFRAKVVAGGMDIDGVVSDIMSAPLIRLPGDSPVFEAILTMVEKNIKHLAVEDASGKVIGVTSNNSLLIAQGQSPVALMRDIREESTPQKLFGRQKEIAPLVRALIQRGAQSDHLNRMISTIADTFLSRLVEFALAELGKPPAPFTFMIMGSEGRKEQTLKTDQDNAIIYADVPDSRSKETAEYFLALGKKVCGWLDAVGYQYCNGEVMAQNPRWNQPLGQWKEYFAKWINTPEPMAVMHSTIFFDFTTGYGDENLTRDLRKYLGRLLRGRQTDLFYYHLTMNAMRMKPPLGFFRNFVVESRGDHRNTFDIKKAMTPIVDFARSYALKNGVDATNTLERLKGLKEKKVLKEKEYQELVQGYRYMMQTRISRQVTAIMDEHNPPDNYINPRKLTQIEQRLLKEIFSLVGDYQEKMSLHFTRGQA